MSRTDGRRCLEGMTDHNATDSSRLAAETSSRLAAETSSRLAAETSSRLAAETSSRLAAETNVVVIGGGYAGTTAANHLRMRTAVNITLVKPRPKFVERIRLHQHAAGNYNATVAYGTLLGEGVALVVDNATRIDTAARKVELASGAALDYDHLIYAVGSTGVAPWSVPGAAEFAYPIGELEYAQRLRAKLAELRPDAPITVVGAGLTGTETAAELAEHGHAVTLVCGGNLVPSLSEQGRRYTARWHQISAAHQRDRVSVLGEFGGCLGTGQPRADHGDRSVRAQLGELGAQLLCVLQFTYWVGEFGCPRYRPRSHTGAADRVDQVVVVKRGARRELDFAGSSVNTRGVVDHECHALAEQRAVVDGRVVVACRVLVQPDALDELRPRAAKSLWRCDQSCPQDTADRLCVT